MSTAPPKATAPWFPDQKVWAGGLTYAVAWILLSQLQRVGFDPQPLVSAVSGGTLDATALLSGIIAWGVAYWLPPSLHDIVSRVNNRIVQIANADQANPTTAIIVGEDASLQAAKVSVATGIVPTNELAEPPPVAKGPAGPPPVP